MGVVREGGLRLAVFEGGVFGFFRVPINSVSATYRPIFVTAQRSQIAFIGRYTRALLAARPVFFTVPVAAVYHGEAAVGPCRHLYVIRCCFVGVRDELLGRIEVGGVDRVV